MSVVGLIFTPHLGNFVQLCIFHRCFTGILSFFYVFLTKNFLSGEYRTVDVRTKPRKCHLCGHVVLSQGIETCRSLRDHWQSKHAKHFKRKIWCMLCERDPRDPREAFFYWVFSEKQFKTVPKDDERSPQEVVSDHFSKFHPGEVPSEEVLLSEMDKNVSDREALNHQSRFVRTELQFGQECQSGLYRACTSEKCKEGAHRIKCYDDKIGHRCV